jgi:hypothetical protein
MDLKKRRKRKRLAIEPCLYGKDCDVCRNDHEAKGMATYCDLYYENCKLKEPPIEKVCKFYDRCFYQYEHNCVMPEDGERCVFWDVCAGLLGALGVPVKVAQCNACDRPFDYRHNVPPLVCPPCAAIGLDKEYD